MKQPIIGVFDSGVGGASVVRAIKKALPEANIIYADDTDNLPYGTKSPDMLMQLVVPKLQQLVTEDCQVIVIACNTVTTTLIEKLRQIFEVPIIGMEPMIKPAAQQTRAKVIAVCATPTTLSSQRYAWLKREYCQFIKVLEPDCSDWAQMIENNQLNRQQIFKRINAVCQAGADVIVLGCTHYHWIEDIIKEASAGRAVVLQPEEPVIAQLKQVLERLP